MSIPILRTKLYIPQPRPKIVLRPRLVARLNEGLHCKLTLVAAPAGFGKTTLLSQWVAACARPTAWLSLSEEDGEVTRFLAYFAAALQTISPAIGAETPHSPQPPSREAVLTALINDIATLPQDTVLILDDYHLVDALAVDEVLAFLLEHLPPQLHLVIATREDPQLPLARWRARDELAEIRAADLRFSYAEAAEYLNQLLGLSLSAEHIAALESRTEGWITGLHLAATSMLRQHDVGAFIQSFTGSHRFVLDYLVEEVLQEQTPAVQTFLLYTSILDRLCGSLCDAVVGDATAPAQETLEYLERANLLIVPLDDHRQWYRYHHLFADVLSAYLQKEQPGQVPELHRRAAAWYEQHGAPFEATRHALAGADFARAARWLELALPEVEDSGNWHRWRGWIKRLPEDLLRSRPVLSAGYAWALLTGGELEAAEAWLRDAERWLETEHAGGDGGMVIVDEEQLRQLPASLATARAFQSQARGDVAGTVRHARRTLDLVAEANHPRRRQATALLGLTYWASGDLEATYRAFTEFMASLLQGGNINDALTLTYVLADIAVALGRLHEALAIYQRSLQVGADPGPLAPIGVDHIYRGMSALYIQWDDLPTAMQHLATARELSRQAASPDWQHRLFITEALLAQAQGALDRALELLSAAEHHYIRTPLPDVRPIAALKARVLIRQDRLAEAQAWAHEADLAVGAPISYLREFEYITLARLLIAQSRRETTGRTLQVATGLLERLLRAAHEGGRTGSVIEILLLQALAQAAGGDSAAALASLKRALALAEPQGYVRVFVDEGAPLATLLREAAQQASAPNYVRRLLAALGQRTDETPATQLVVEPLSERELEVLRLLASELSGPQIAHQLTVSLHTVRSHTKSIYGKLSVNSRRLALRRAAELDLL